MEFKFCFFKKILCIYRMILLHIEVFFHYSTVFANGSQWGPYFLMVRSNKRICKNLALILSLLRKVKLLQVLECLNTVDNLVLWILPYGNIQLSMHCENYHYLYYSFNICSLSSHAICCLLDEG